MPARVLPLELSKIFPQGVEDHDELQPFIDTAHLIVDEELLNAGHSESRLKLIEMYLAAHLAVISLERGGVVKKTIGEAEETYQSSNQNTTGLVTTRFGQQVITLDTSGRMAAITQHPVKAVFRVCS